jgi:hypothetical protein
LDPIFLLSSGLNFGGYAVGSASFRDVDGGKFVVWSLTLNFVRIAGGTEI